MGEIVWSPQAADNLRAIADYIADDSPIAADNVVDGIIRAVRKLERYPQSGRMIPELEQRDHREIIVGAYRVMYRVLPDHVRITSIIHGARDWPDDPAYADPPA